MLLDLIEHQEELFAAIIASLNYRSLCVLRVTCRGLFAAISGAHRWQHMRNFAPSLRQINSICRAILCDDHSVQTTIIFRNECSTFYRMNRQILEIYRDYSSRTHRYTLCDMVVRIPARMCIYKIKNQLENIPIWLSKHILSLLHTHCEILIDIRP
jgi:hypothetical protein